MQNSRRNLIQITITLALLIFQPVFSLNAQEENLSVLSRWTEHSDAGNVLIHHLNQLAYECLDRRDSLVAGLKTGEQWRRRQGYILKTMEKMVGTFPPKTPLNPRITGIVERDGYRIEKVIFESMPRFYITGCLFIPEGAEEKRPAILNAIGHSPQAFRRDVYQVLILNLVKKGFIVFAIDPLGQGERLQYYDPEKKETLIGPGNPTVEHSYCGNQCFIAGNALARYWTWDCIRAIDYLVTRSEVDPERIGMTGCSGGGTQTAYASALDRRVKAAAPSCYLTSARRLLEFVGPQDAEHNFYRGIVDGVTSAELHVLRAPLPTLLVATTRDYYSIQGARETFREVKKAYQALGKPENLEMAEDDSEHGFTRKNNESIYAFFQKHLDWPGSSKEEEVQVLEEEELNITPTGMLSTYLEGETVFSINKRETEELIIALAESRKDLSGHLEKVRRNARELSGYIAPKPEKEPVYRGRYSRGNYTIEKWALYGEGDYMIPLLLFVPAGQQSEFPALIYLHPEGKAAEAEPGGRIEQLVNMGFVVAAADLIGTGETATRQSRRAREVAAFTALLVGRSIVGIQAGDVSRVANFLKHRDDVSRESIGAVGFGELCPALLHAAAFDKSIGPVALVDPLVSYRSLVVNRFYEYDFFSAVAAALTAYDLPDLAGCIAPRKLLMLSVRDQMKRPVAESMVENELAITRKAFSLKNSAENLKVMSSLPEQRLDSLLYWWLN
ncbi:MAG: prolyl oligopeptidase family serine peptidase [Candidatus Glassbacteria bacterium]|nr:prolyl oligopeptidase family serine peptidase [Candidatus Glassbacteria bacterium]